MSPTPMSFASPTSTSAYALEATNEGLAALYGIPVDRIARFDLNTSVAPPGLVARILASGRLDTPISEYPPSDYARLVAIAAERYGVSRDEVIVGAGADEILDIATKAFLPPGGRAVLPVPTYAMYRVLSEQRGARVVAVPRRPEAEGYAVDLAAVRAAARGADFVWLCDPNNPTARSEPEGAVEALLRDLAADARSEGVEPPVVALDEAYAEFVGRSHVALRESYPRLVVVRTVSKAYQLAGLRVGFGIAVPPTIEVMAPYRPPGSVSVVSVSVAADVMADPAVLEANLARVAAERERLAQGLADGGWRVGPSVTNFLLVDLGSAEHAEAVAESLLRRGLVPRTFPAGHPLASHLRITVRDREQDDRLIEAVREIEAMRSSPEAGGASGDSRP